MEFTYRVMTEDGTFVAECLESEAAGEGKTEAAAVQSLRKVLEERMFRPDAVAPPSNPAAQERIELRPAMTESTAKEVDMPDLGGPGDPPQPRR